jgi:uncharacterized RDD family membrane protein YckC
LPRGIGSGYLPERPPSGAGTVVQVAEDRRRRSPVGRVIGSIVNPVVDAVEPDELLDRIDVNALLERIDMDRLLARIDIETVLDRIDLDAILDRVDIDRLLDRIDVDRVLDRVDVNRMVGRVDVEDVIARVDVDAVVRRAGIEELVQRSSRGIVTQLIDLGRRQLAGVDIVLHRLVARVLHRPTDPETRGAASITGEPAGAATRLAAFALDSVLLTTLFGAGIAVVAYVADLVLATDWKPERATNVAWSIAFLAWAAFYFVFGWALAGRTPGLGLTGLRVVAHRGDPVSFRAALLRIIVFPTCFIAGIGAIGIVLGRRHRALHDVAARTLVIYDWGEREAAAPAPLARWLARQHVDLDR